MLTTEMPIIGPNSLNNVFGVVDTYSTTSTYNGQLNGALNPLGSLWTIPSPSQGGNTILATAAGYGSFLTVKYVRYNSTANPAMVAGPAVVYYTDETFTTVSGVFSEGNVTGTGSASSVAGVLLPNTGSVAGVGLGTGVTAALLNGNYVFIAVAGFVPSCVISSGTQGSGVSGASGNFASVIQSGILRPYGYVWSAITSTIADVLVTCGQF